MPERTRWSQIGLTLVATTIIAAMRRPDAFGNPQFFVEDGTVFFADDYELGANALFKPYAGYLHTLPRLVAWLAASFPLEHRPAIYCGACLVLLWGLHLLILSPRQPLPHRPFFALATMLVPIGGFIYLHLTNIQWFAGLALILLLLQHPARNAAEWLLDLGLIVVLGLTGPFSLALLFLWPLRAVHYGTNHYDTVAFAVLAGTAMTQSHFLLEASDTLGKGSFSHVDVDYISRHGANLLLGRQWPQYLENWNWLPTLLLLTLLAALILRTPERHRMPSVTFAVTGILFTVLGLYRVHPEARSANAFVSASRYFLIPHVCAVWCTLLALSAASLTRNVARALLFMFALSAATLFDRPRPKDMRWASYCERIRSGVPVTVPINWPGWKIRLNDPH